MPEPFEVWPDTFATPARPGRATRSATPRTRRPVVEQPVDDTPAFVTPSTIPESWPDVTTNDKTKLVCSMGIELTMMSTLLTGGDGDDEICRAVANLIKATVKHRGAYKWVYQPTGVHTDAYAVEAPSIPLKTWGALRSFYDAVSPAMLGAGCSPHHMTITSGGGHIHCGGLSVALMANILRDVQNKPWLSWVFNEPDDSRSAGTFTTDVESVTQELKELARTINVKLSLVTRQVNEAAKAAFTFYADTKNIEAEMLPSSKSDMLLYNDEHETLEFRFFEAPANWAEQLAHVKFLDAYIRWAKTEYATKDAVVVMDTSAKLKALTLPECEAAFLSFLTVLGLPPGPYARMLDQNLAYRFVKGTRT